LETLPASALILLHFYGQHLARSRPHGRFSPKPFSLKPIPRFANPGFVEFLLLVQIFVEGIQFFGGKVVEGYYLVGVYVRKPALSSCAPFLREYVG